MNHALAAVSLVAFMSALGPTGSGTRLDEVLARATNHVVRCQRVFSAADAGESGRDNLGPVARPINVPTLPLRFLEPARRARFSFRKRGEEQVGSVRARRVGFGERSRPTIIRTPVGGRDVPTSGDVWLDPLTGSVVKAEVVVRSPEAAAAADPPRPGAGTVRAWQARKFGLFIHFGPYSALGGVWNGAPVTRGYSEQIRRHAPISRERYAEVAAQFNPTAWDPDAVARLARAAGMKFVVITAKHHDGFNMFRTGLSAFNIAERTPYRRDVVKELADACRRHGLAFGVYYSTIDWHDPRATGPSAPPTRENDNPIPKAHEDFNVAQIRELVSNYGPLSEIWFDMGRPSPAQSRRFANTVHAVQPECMVSGRVFNSQGDFTVLGDNELPTSPIEEPWQTPGSIYDETWGYRSWQERTDLAGKTAEHILRLVRVVSRGGNYLLNIGPRGDGSVVPFEADVLRGIGRWLAANGEAIYDTAPQPFRELEFGNATVKPGRLYLFVTKWPADGRLRLPGLKTHVTKAYFLDDRGTPLPVDDRPGSKSVDVSSRRADGPVSVVAVEFGGALEVLPPSISPDAGGRLQLPASGATRFYNYNGRGYYDPRTVYQMRWDIAPAPGTYRVDVTYRGGGPSARVAVSVGSRTVVAGLPATLGDTPRTVPAGTVTLAAAESIPLVVSPPRPFARGEKLAAAIERVVLVPVP